jgi:hypothetical protein
MFFKNKKYLYLILLSFAFSINAEAALWTPSQVSPTIWYDASDATTITASTTDISQWRSKVGSSHLNQSTPSLRPLYGTRTINGLNTVEFDGTDDRMSLASLTVVSGAPTKREIWAVVSVDNTSDEPIFANTSSSELSIITNQLKFYGGALGPYGNATSTDIGTTPSILGFIGDSFKKYSINGTLETTADALAGLATNRITVTQLGYRTTGSAFDGVMGELIVGSSNVISSTSTREKIEGYLAWKWGLQGKLPSDHTYKNAAPIAPPTTPTGLTASSVSTSSLALSWTTVSDTDGYEISANNGFATTTTTATSTIITGLSSGTSYTFNVSAYNAGGTSSAATTTATTSVTLSYIADPIKGSITGSTTQVVIYGGSGTEVTAVPDTSGIHYHFDSWSDGATSTSRTDTNITSDTTFTATFATHDDIVEYIAGPNGSITGSTTQDVSHGASTTPVTAVPNAGYRFVNWSDGSTSNPRYEIYADGPLSVTANFEEAPQGKKSGSSVKTRIVNLIDMGKTKEAQVLADKFPQAITPQIQNTIDTNTNSNVRDLEITLSGEDVRALQNILISKGYAIPAGATGYFGTQTQSALIKYQRDNNIIPAIGYFGKITRGQMRGIGITI